MGIYDDPDMKLEEITQELEHFILDMVLAGLESLNMEYRAFRRFQKQRLTEKNRHKEHEPF